MQLLKNNKNMAGHSFCLVSVYAYRFFPGIKLQPHCSSPDLNARKALSLSEPSPPRPIHLQLSASSLLVAQWYRQSRMDAIRGNQLITH